MSESSEPIRPRLLSSAPVLCATAITPLMDYLVEKLGFAVQGRAGDPPSWASLQRDSVELMLVCGNFPAPAQDWAAYLYVTNVDALYEEFVARGADVRGPPQDKPYNCREIEVRLPDGRVLAFGA
jgi:uncharacterized glyoxalase superfamily protein PhnB